MIERLMARYASGLTIGGGSTLALIWNVDTVIREYFALQIFRMINFRVKYFSDKRPLTALSLIVRIIFACLIFGLAMLSENILKRKFPDLRYLTLVPVPCKHRNQFKWWKEERRYSQQSLRADSACVWWGLHVCVWHWTRGSPLETHYGMWIVYLILSYAV